MGIVAEIVKCDSSGVRTSAYQKGMGLGLTKCNSSACRKGFLCHCDKCPMVMMQCHPTGAQRRIGEPD